MSDDTASHYDHVKAPPCDECAQEQKRLAMISAVAGALLGAGLIAFYFKKVK